MAGIPENPSNNIPSIPGMNLPSMQGQPISRDLIPELIEKNPPIPETIRGDQKEDGISGRLKSFISNINIAKGMDEEKLDEIGEKVIQHTEYDEESRVEWFDQLQDAMKIAKQVKNSKNYPWPGAANIKYPLLINACIQYNSRMMPEVIQNDQVVKFDVMRPDPDDNLEDLARRLSAHMSYQRLRLSKHWRKECDRLLMILPMVGTVFKKSYWDNCAQIPESDLCLPDDIVINSRVKSLESAERVTHKLYFNDNGLLEKMNGGMFKEYTLEELRPSPNDDSTEIEINPDREHQSDTDAIQDKIHVLYEQHTFLDLDDDGYKEPYIVTVHFASKKVLRIVSRYDQQSLVFNKKTGRLVRIDPIQYFTDYHFIPSPDGDYYSLGFGKILYPLNESINTILNQLLDAGTLSNLGGGFIGKSMRIKKGPLRVKPGEWTWVDSVGQNLSQNIVPYPVKEPSPILFQLLGLLIQSAEELISLSDVMQGQAPPSNTAASTVSNMVEQGMKIYTSILQRFNEDQGQEFEKLYQLNRKYLSDSQYYKNSVGTGMINPTDYEVDDFGIFPVADPEMSTESKRLARAQMLLQLPQQIPGIDPHEVGMRFLRTMRFPAPEKLLPPPPPPDPSAPPPLQDQLLIAQIENTKAVTENTKMETADYLMKRELEGIEADIKEQRLDVEKEQVAAEVDGGQVDSMLKIADLEETVSQNDIQNALNVAKNIHSETLQQMGQPFKGSEPLTGRIQELNKAIGQEIGLPGDQSQQQGGLPAQQESQDNQVETTEPLKLPEGESGLQAAFPKSDPELLEEFSNQIEHESSGKNSEKGKKGKSPKSTEKSLKPPLPKLPSHVPEGLPESEA